MSPAVSIVPFTIRTTSDANQNELIMKSEVVPLSNKTHKDLPNDDSVSPATTIVPVTTTTTATDTNQNKFDDDITTNISTRNNDASVPDTCYS